MEPVMPQPAPVTVAAAGKVASLKEQLFTEQVVELQTPEEHVVSMQSYPGCSSLQVVPDGTLSPCLHSDDHVVPSGSPVTSSRLHGIAPHCGFLVLQVPSVQVGASQ